MPSGVFSRHHLRLERLFNRPCAVFALFPGAALPAFTAWDTGLPGWQFSRAMSSPTDTPAGG